MVSLPELANDQICRLEILYGDSAWKTGGHHATLPSRDLHKFRLKLGKKT
jgi:hypothetical protein